LEYAGINSVTELHQQVFLLEIKIIIDVRKEVRNHICLYGFLKS